MTSTFVVPFHFVKLSVSFVRTQGKKVVSSRNANNLNIPGITVATVAVRD